MGRVEFLAPLIRAAAGSCGRKALLEVEISQAKARAKKLPTRRHREHVAELTRSRYWLNRQEWEMVRMLALAGLPALESDVFYYEVYRAEQPFAAIEIGIRGNLAIVHNFGAFDETGVHSHLDPIVGKNTLGLSTVRAIFAALMQCHPDVAEFVGERRIAGHAVTNARYRPRPRDRSTVELRLVQSVPADDPAVETPAEWRELQTALSLMAQAKKLAAPPHS